MENTLPQILSIDIGGTHIKATVLNSKGELLVGYKKLPTPNPANPQNVMETIQKLLIGFPLFDKISAGFPGYIKNGTVITAPNLGTKAWQQTNLAEMLSKTLGKPAKVINDADMQGLGIVSGKGLELMITLGTGFGTAILQDGKLMPHIELSQHPFTKSKNYDQYVGEKALQKIGNKKWNKRMQKVIETLAIVFNFDRLYLGGGNAQLLKEKLPRNCSIVTNQDAIDGGVKLWI